MILVVPPIGPTTRKRGRSGKGRRYRELVLAHLSLGVRSEDLRHLSASQAKKLIPRRDLRTYLRIQEEKSKN